jgi:hypothetical protein
VRLVGFALATIEGAGHGGSVPNSVATPGAAASGGEWLGYVVKRLPLAYVTRVLFGTRYLLFLHTSLA